MTKSPKGLPPGLESRYLNDRLLNGESGDQYIVETYQNFRSPYVPEAKNSYLEFYYDSPPLINFCHKDIMELKQMIGLPVFFNHETVWKNDISSLNQFLEKTLKETLAYFGINTSTDFWKETWEFELNQLINQPQFQNEPSRFYLTQIETVNGIQKYIEKKALVSLDQLSSENYINLRDELLTISNGGYSPELGCIDWLSVPTAHPKTICYSRGVSLEQNRQEECAVEERIPQLIENFQFMDQGAPAEEMILF